MDAFVLKTAHALLKRQAIVEDAEKKDSNVGSAAKESSPSVSALVSTLVPNLVIFSVFVLGFILLRKTNRRIYYPRSYVGTIENWRKVNPEEHFGTGYGGMFGWVKGLWAIPETVILRTAGLDGYFFLRYLQRASMILFFGCCITFPILFPINITGGNGESGLNILSFSNISEANKNRNYAHVLVGIVFFSFVLFTIYRELIFFTTLKQAYLLSPLYSSRISSRTVLITSIPPDCLNESALLRIFDNVTRIWINRDTKEIEELVEERDETALKLEAAEVKLIKTVDKARRKGGEKTAQHDEEVLGQDGESGSVAGKFIDQSDRPTHKLKSLVGEKVDTIDWCRGHLSELIPKVEALQAKYIAGDARKLNSAFIEFTSQSAAQAAVQVLAHHQPLHMAPRYIGISPEEIVWDNMQLIWWQRLVRIWGSTAFVVALVIFWSIPVAVVGAISQIDALTKYSWLAWINDIPKPILGVITGLLPAVMLAILMALLPIILRIMAKIQGAPSLSHVELKVQNMYFAFQVVQVFLITTLSAGAFQSLTKLMDNPSSAADLLARSLPKASNFYVSYLILQGLALSGGALLNIAGLVLYKLLGAILDSTPRKKWHRWATLSGLGWGTVFPIYTNLCVIAITYSIIAPLVAFVGCCALFLLYFAYKHNVLFVYATDIDTKGAVYPRALYQTLTGVYLAQLCLIGLFGIKKSVGPLIIQVLFLIFTVLVQLTLTSSIQPLLDFLPRSVGDNDPPLSDSELESQASNNPDPKLAATADPAAPPQTRPEEAHRTNVFNNQLQKVGALAKFLHPEKHFSYEKLRPLIPQVEGYHYTPEQAQNAYIHPAVKSKPITIWIPRDEAGVSKQEVAHTQRVLEASDEGAWLDEKGKLVREEEANPPGYVVEPRY
ncbi:putative DUF221 domain protein [Ascobolus immersus RN42]|uniref:Putative DUF221 domain protein n=1 Tax=Ascobolus immersus RN42 TaxID=1160509 RepID=A0A3N4HXL9_ASCIM|nr:putative DUF221 domain protein [Ascobolus immersus RN42]